MIGKRQFYIDGSWVEPSQRDDLDVIDPSTEEVCAVISLASPADVDAAVAAARRAFPHWAATSVAQRKGFIEGTPEACWRK
jgi:aldehyde dehydrogenase (NAD+)